MQHPKQDCEWCGKPFQPDRYNIGRQKYCKEQDCKDKRRRHRQLSHYHRSCNDDNLRKQENERRRRDQRRRRQERRQIRANVLALSSVPVPSPVPSELPVISVSPVTIAPLLGHEILVGVVALLHGSSDPVLVARQLDEYRKRGRRLAIPMAGCGLPDG